MTIMYYDESTSHDVIYSGQDMAMDFDVNDGTVVIRRPGTYRMVVQGPSNYTETIVVCEPESCETLHIALVDNSMLIVTELSGNYAEFI